MSSVVARTTWDNGWTFVMAASRPTQTRQVRRRAWLQASLAVLAVAGAAVLLAPPAHAHEFWLEPVNYNPSVGETVPVVQRLGSDFAGDSYPYLSADTRRFALIDARGEHAIKSVEGDDPAADVTFSQRGLARIVYVGAVNEVVFETFAKFEESLRYELLAHIIPLHTAANKPRTRIVEHYVRYAKALVAVGNAKGVDTPVGMPFELVAETNPYSAKANEPITMRLLLDGKPAAGITVKIFNHDTPTAPDLAVTGEDGRMAVELPRRGQYLVHAVHMRAPRPDEGGDWFSLWASLTFVRP